MSVAMRGALENDDMALMWRVHKLLDLPSNTIHHVTSIYGKARVLHY
jgi:hypothetical protein